MIPQISTQSKHQLIIKIIKLTGKEKINLLYEKKINTLFFSKLNYTATIIPNVSKEISNMFTYFFGDF